MAARCQLLAAGLTDRGLRRESNEDGFLCDPDSGLFAVADGLGGLPCGEVASRIALGELRRLVSGLPRDTEPDWPAIFDTINRMVLLAGREVGAPDGIGSTLTAVRALPGRLSVAHVGDSGLFAFPPEGGAVRLTRDHTMAQDMLDAHGPGYADSIPERFHHALTQCLGQPAELLVETRSVPLAPGVRLLLYTDGVTKTQTPGELARLAAAAATPEALVADIVARANACGGPDNVTAVALFCAGPKPRLDFRRPWKIFRA